MKGPSGILRVGSTASDAQSGIENARAKDEINVCSGKYDASRRTKFTKDVALRFTRNTSFEPSTDYTSFFVHLDVVAHIPAVTICTRNSY